MGMRVVAGQGHGREDELRGGRAGAVQQPLVGGHPERRSGRCRKSSRGCRPPNVGDMWTWIFHEVPSQRRMSPSALVAHTMPWPSPHTPRRCRRAPSSGIMGPPGRRCDRSRRPNRGEGRHRARRPQRRGGVVDRRGAVLRLHHGARVGIVRGVAGVCARTRTSRHRAGPRSRAQARRWRRYRPRPARLGAS